LLLGRARVNFDAKVVKLRNQETSKHTTTRSLFSPFRTRDDTDLTTRSPSSSWSNPLAAPLPRAPNMKILCLYGVGISTERGYFYEVEKTPTGVNIDSTDDCPVEPSLMINRSRNFNLILPEVDRDLENKAQGFPEVRGGVAYSDGDGLVPILSLGLMCTDSEESGVGWGPVGDSSVGVHRTNSRNPGGAEVTIREYKHEGRSTFQAVRNAAGGGEFRGSKSADHVDILGNYEVC
jgi:phospholipid:diacylglycerol acyltransferase